jgi:mitogen-activated protein kinase 15
MGPLPEKYSDQIEAQAEPLSLTNYCGSRWYRSPEQLVDAKNYTTAIDIWAVGCVIAEMIQKRPIFPGTCTLSQLTHIVHITGRPPDVDLSNIQSKYVVSILEGLGKSKQGNLMDLIPAATPEVRDLVRLCLQFNPDKRLTAEEALEHPFLGHFHNPDAELNHSSVFAGGVVLPLSDDVQYPSSVYRDRLYADVLRKPRSIKRINTERLIKRERLHVKPKDPFGVDPKLADQRLIYRG